jgi:FtsZ-interacting cell division protein ZipA
MNHTLIFILILIGVIIIAALVAYSLASRRRSQILRRRFGPEYDRVLRQEKSVHRAEGVLEFRRQARQTLQIHPLSRQAQESYTVRWNEVQRHFVDDPPAAVLEADELISEVMEQRGYPVGNFEQRAEIMSVDHPVVVQNYRAAHDIAARQRTGQATTEDLRKAMVHYRSLFDEILRDDEYLNTKEAHG